jgi:hypothetical protein
LGLIVLLAVRPFSFGLIEVNRGNKESHMKAGRFLISILLTAMLAVGSIPMSYAQPGNATASVALTLTVGESLTLSCTPATLVVPPDGTQSGAITCTTSWNFSAGDNTQLGVDSYFTTPAQALNIGGTGANIPSSSITATNAIVSGPITTGTGAAGPCNKTDAHTSAASAGGTCPAWWYTGTAPTQSSNTEVATETLSYSGLQSALVAGTYSGTLNIVAFTS